MRAVLLVAKGEGRRRIVSLVGLALIVDLVGAAVLGAVGGARRSASAIDRFRDTADTRDGRAFAITFGDPVGDDLVAEMAALDGVAEVGGASIHPTDALFDIDVSLVLPFDDVAYQRIDRPLVLDGRLPDPTADDEVVIDELAVDRLGLRTGDRFRASTFSLDDCAALTTDAFPGFNGPRVDLEIVGEVRVIEELQGGDIESGPVLIASPAIGPTLGDDACATGFLAPFRFGGGEPPSAEAMTAAVRRAAPDAPYAQAGTIETEILDSVRSAANVAIVALIAFAIVAGLAGLLGALVAFFVVLGLGGLAHAMAVSARRHRGLFATLRSLGFVRGQVARSVLTCATAIVGISLVVGVPLGIVAGRLAWQAEVGDLGILDAPSVPVAALAVIVGLALVGGAAVAAVPAWRSSRRHPAAVLRAE